MKKKKEEEEKLQCYAAREKKKKEAEKAQHALPKKGNTSKKDLASHQNRGSVAHS